MSKPPKGAQVDWGHPLARGLVYAALYNEASGPRVWDVAGRTNGAMSGGSKWVSARKGPGVGSRAGTEKIEASLATLPNGSASSFTIASWVRTYAYVSLASAWGFGGQLPAATSGDGTGRYLLQFNNHYYFWGFNADWDTGIAWDIDANWHHIVFTFDGTTLRFYRDGVLTATGTPSRTLSTAGDFVTAFSFYSSGGTTAANMDLDIGLIYSRTLSADEITRLYSESYAFIQAPAARRWLAAPTGGTTVFGPWPMVNCDPPLKLPLIVMPSQ